MRTIVALITGLGALIAAAAPAGAQPRDFSCVGAERLEDDVIAVPFARNSATLGPAARSAVATAAALAAEQTGRNICVFGHADRTAGAETSTRLAVRRARAVAEALSEHRVERDRVRAEARVGAFSGRVSEPGERAVTIILMPNAGTTAP